jgi:hypothetical protein
VVVAVAATLVERIGSAPLDPGAERLIADHGPVEETVTGALRAGAGDTEPAEAIDTEEGP